jgi:hypothetical protein
MKSSLCSMVLVFAVLGVRVADAAPKKSDAEARKAAAAALFQDGLEAMQAGRTAEGCDKLAESVATIPDSGAKGALAECYTAIGKLSESWDLWRELANSAPTAELRDDASKNAAALDKRLARVVINVRGAVPAGLTVTLNDKPVAAVSTTEHRVTPGKLTVIAESPEIERWSQTLTAKEGEKLDVDIHAVVSRSSVAHRQHGRKLGLVVGGVGVLAIGVGAVFGGLAYSSHNSAESSCGGDVEHCKSAGYLSAQSDLDSARSRATISSWAVGTGLVAAATGAIIYLVYSEPRHAESATAWRIAPTGDSQSVGVSLSRSLP